MECDLNDYLSLGGNPVNIAFLCSPWPLWAQKSSSEFFNSARLNGDFDRVSQRSASLRPRFAPVDVYTCVSVYRVGKWCGLYRAALKKPEDFATKEPSHYPERNLISDLCGHLGLMLFAISLGCDQDGRLFELWNFQSELISVRGRNIPTLGFT
ncbi:hypothetical protein TcasGA2_TC014066 [Tribolium castaneum]|uniref:Uncharacterized protein n=1 Tax=Tribolium castaneum TaxID=7070 RepID=D6WK04_TRICA|nr:hypothetical protein TcasGA2_TC014066 [Tribolium castaneum]